jgi:hypothetical protein
VLEGVRSIKSILEIYVVVHVGCCWHSVQYVFYVGYNGMLNISGDDHVLVGMIQTVYVELPIYISSYL